MQLGLSECPLEPKQETIVEVGGIVGTVFVDHQRCGQSTELDQAVPIEIRAGES